MILDSIGMVLLTLPFVFPIIKALGFDPVWFGVLVVLTLEMGLISPPVGVNVFIVKSVARKVPLGQIFVGVMPSQIAEAFASSATGCPARKDSTCSASIACVLGIHAGSRGGNRGRGW